MAHKLIAVVYIFDSVVVIICGKDLVRAQEPLIKFTASFVWVSYEYLLADGVLSDRVTPVVLCSISVMIDILLGQSSVVLNV